MRTPDNSMQPRFNLGAFILTTVGLCAVALVALSVFSTRQIETASASPAAAYEQQRAWAAVDDQTAHGAIRDFECKISGFPRTTLSLSWDAPAGWSAAEYRVAYAVHRVGTDFSYTTVVEDAVDTTDPAFQYNFSQLPALDDGESYDITVHVHVRSDGTVSPVSGTAYALHFEALSPMTGLETCEQYGND